jgi:hypothetical protein
MRRAQIEMFEEAQILFPNFAGVAKMYNAEGDRNFNLVLTQDQADDLASKGWNVKVKEGRDDGDPNRYLLEVAVMFGSWPPTIVLISSRGRTVLDEETCDIIDRSEIEFCDVVIRPYQWSVNGNSGIKAYLKAIYVNLHEDRFKLKYDDLPEANS